MQIITTSGEGNRVPEECRFRLPNGEGVKKKVWSSGGKDGRAMPCRIKPLAVQDEKKLVNTIIEELRNLLALDLDPSPTLEMRLGIQSKTKVRVDYLFIGSSNASKLRTALEAKGRSVALVFLANFRLDRHNEGLLRVVREAMLQSEPKCVVIQLLDSSCFTARGPDGSRTLAKKMVDGKFHIPGDVVLCPKETQQEHFESLRSLLDLVEKKT
jgi:hypothetical protein